MITDALSDKSSNPNSPTLEQSGPSLSAALRSSLLYELASASELGVKRFPLGDGVNSLGVRGLARGYEVNIGQQYSKESCYSLTEQGAIRWSRAVVGTLDLDPALTRAYAAYRSSDPANSDWMADLSLPKRRDLDRERKGLPGVERRALDAVADFTKDRRYLDGYRSLADRLWDGTVEGLRGALNGFVDTLDLPKALGTNALTAGVVVVVGLGASTVAVAVGAPAVAGTIGISTFFLSFAGFMGGGSALVRGLRGFVKAWRGEPPSHE